MTTIADVRAELAEIITANLDGWVGSQYVGDTMNSGVIVVTRPQFDPRMIFSGAKVTITFQLTAYASRTTPEASEAALDALCEPTGYGSLIEALQDGDNWSITVDYAQVVECGRVSVVQYGTDAAEFLACPFQVEVCF